MAKTLKIRAVQAPSHVGWWAQMELRRQGRQDARRYKSLNDYTRTHALIVAQNKTNAGQRNVNQWVIQSLEPIRTGNARILVQLELLAERLEKIQVTSETSGRKKLELSAQADRLEKQISNFTSQYQTNIAAAESIFMQGEQAIGSWANYYEQLAGIYTRARAAKLKLDVSSVEAEVPALESIQLIEIPELFNSPGHEKDLKKK